MILQDNSLEFCNALTVFMATSKDLKFSDCHNELVITCRGEKEKKTKSMLYEKKLYVCNQDKACHQLSPEALYRVSMDFNDTSPLVKASDSPNPIK